MSLITLITPMLALQLGSLLNHEALQQKAVIGAALILSGLFLYEWQALRKLVRRNGKEYRVSR